MWKIKHALHLLWFMLEWLHPFNQKCNIGKGWNPCFGNLLIFFLIVGIVYEMDMLVLF
jgi:hypothetical protein